MKRCFQNSCHHTGPPHESPVGSADLPVGLPRGEIRREFTALSMGFSPQGKSEGGKTGVTSFPCGSGAQSANLGWENSLPQPRGSAMADCTTDSWR